MVQKLSIREILLILISIGGPAIWGAPLDQTAKAWAQVPTILARIKPPKFPGREFPVTKYGAVGDGVTDCRKRFAKAIDECNRAGGGVRGGFRGTFLTGAIHLKSNVNLLSSKRTRRFCSPRTGRIFAGRFRPL